MEVNRIHKLLCSEISPFLERPFSFTDLKPANCTWAVLQLKYLHFFVKYVRRLGFYGVEALKLLIVLSMNSNNVYRILRLLMLSMENTNQFYRSSTATITPNSKLLKKTENDRLLPQKIKRFLFWNAWIYWQIQCK